MSLHICSWICHYKNSPQLQESRGELHKIAGYAKPLSLFSCFSVALLLLKRRIHLAAVAVALSVRQFLHAQLGRAPLDYLNFYNSAAPLVHKLVGGLVNVDGAGVYQSTAVVIHHINVGLTLNFETRTQGVYGPVCGCTPDLVCIFKGGANGVAWAIGNVVALCMSVGRCANNAVSLGRMIERHTMLIPA